jgi:hypothetical protein
MAEELDFVTTEECILDKFPELREIPDSDRRLMFIASVTSCRDAAEINDVSKAYVDKMWKVYGPLFEKLSRDVVAVQLLNQLLTMYTTYRAKLKVFENILKNEADSLEAKRWMEVAQGLTKIGIMEKQQVEKSAAEKSSIDPSKWLAGKRQGN